MKTKELKIWLSYTNNSFQIMLSNRTTAAVLLLGKLIRVALFLVFLGFLLQGTNSIAGYSRQQIIFFYLSFNLMDTLAQLFFREVYRFRPLIISGGLDFVLLKPVNSLLRILLGGADLLDLIMIVILSIVTAAFAIDNISFGLGNVLVYFLLLINGLLIATAFHIFVLGLGVMTTSVDHLIMIYRDTTSLLRIPIDLYIEPIRSLLTFVIPLGIMMTFPPKAFLGLLDVKTIISSIFIGLFSLILALKFWGYALKKYSSASS